MGSQQPVKVKDQCLTKMLDGERNLPPDLQHLPQPFVWSTHLEPLLADLDAEAEAPEVQGSKFQDWLPDLYNKQVGMKMKINKYQVRGAHIRSCACFRRCHTRLSRACHMRFVSLDV